ncbi:unnamed protein product [Didymodactylos carnosus]|uniref:Uncharacterized protein n=1 Tax=Didymodactylos carnosus TaxID=1234261 RepID=A0A813QGD8_9BILA|nr:unnamed protein product [Didymodactylos carnosus]CAF3548267.1 unnamed protein product [Didymodactylos carnosus]
MKRGLLSKLLGGGSSDLSRTKTSNLAPSERSKIRDLLKNPIVISLLSAAVGVLVQKMLSSRNMDKASVCENNYVKMATMAMHANPQLKQLLEILGCAGSSKGKYDKKPTTTPTDNDESETADDDDENSEKTLNNSHQEKTSKLHGIMSVFKGQPGSKRKFLKGLFGSSSKNKEIKAGVKLPQSNYKLDKSDADALKNLENELDQYNNKIQQNSP